MAAAYRVEGAAQRCADGTVTLARFASRVEIPMVLRLRLRLPLLAFELLADSGRRQAL